MSQLDLFKQGTSDPGLTARQRFALTFVRASSDPVAGDVLGAALHEYRRAEGGRGHDAGERCRFCTDEGRDMAAALVRKGLVRRAREGGFEPADRAAEPERGYDPATAEIPY